MYWTVRLPRKQDRTNTDETNYIGDADIRLRRTFLGLGVGEATKPIVAAYRLTRLLTA